jgi:pilus assembly protein CpaE
LPTNSPLAVVLAISDAQLEEQIRAHLLDLPARIDIQSPAAGFVDADLLLIDAHQPGGSLEEFLQKWRARFPDAMVGVVHNSAEPQVILAAMRAKADEFIFPPVEPKLNSLLERVFDKKGRVRRTNGKVVGFLSVKGGCGATTVACHVASALAAQSQDGALLADFDLETGLVGFLMKADTRYSILDAFKNLHRLDESYWKGIVAIRKRLDILPAPGSIMAHDPLTPEALRQVLRFVRSMYEWVAVDLGRGLNMVTLAALGELDEIHLVSTPAVASLYRARQCVQHLTDLGFGADRIRLILNQVGKQKLLSSGELRKSVGVPVWAELPLRNELEEAYTDGNLVGLDTELGRRFGQLAANMAGLPRPNKTPNGGSGTGASGFQDLWRRAIPRFSGPA